MNTGKLKKFAQAARRKLQEQVAARMEYVLTTDSAELREKAGPIKTLKDELTRSSREQVIDKVAYTWFNRLVALRFMDANDYQPLGVRIISPKNGYTLPELLDEAKQGNVPNDLPANRQHVMDLLDGKIPSKNPQNEAFKELLIAACNHLHSIFPFLFERINDYTELLLPDELSSELSIVHVVRTSMSQEDCQQVEIIGWLYQFYISEKKDEVFAAKSKVKKEDLPAATQLFTPRWIVEYMVQNTLGKLWLQNHPESGLREHMPYFIESASVVAEDYLRVNSVEEITLLDQACGSGHILVYAFELLAKIYEEQGYSPSEIPRLIIANNLYGFEIDARAAQLAGIALMMKARAYQHRFFRKSNVPQPNILCFQDLGLAAYGLNGYKETTRIRKEKRVLANYFPYEYTIAQEISKQWNETFTDEDTGETVTIERKKVVIKKGAKLTEDIWDQLAAHPADEVVLFRDEIKDAFRLLGVSLPAALYEDLRHMTEATNFGSLIQPQTSLTEIRAVHTEIADRQAAADMYLTRQADELQKALHQLAWLAKKYHCVVDNPPYMGGGKMNQSLSDFVKLNYPDSKADLMACFMESGLAMLPERGFLGMINQHSWMFLSSYEELRKNLIKSVFFDTMLHLGPRTFPEIGGEVVQNTAFTFWNTTLNDKGTYLRLVDYDKSELKKEKVLVAVQNDNCSWLYSADQTDFEKVPGSPIGYWLSGRAFELFDGQKSLGHYSLPRSGMSTTNNTRFLRYWFEVDREKISDGERSEQLAIWHLYNKGNGPRWLSTVEYVVYWKDNGSKIKEWVVSNPKDPKTTHWSRRIFNTEFFFKAGVSWGDISTSRLEAKHLPSGFIFDSVGIGLYDLGEYKVYFLGLLNSKPSRELLHLLCPTMHFNPGGVKNLPVIIEDGIKEKVEANVKECIEITRDAEKSNETSYYFNTNTLLAHNSSIDFKGCLELLKDEICGQIRKLLLLEKEVDILFEKIYFNSSSIENEYFNYPSIYTELFHSSFWKKKITRQVLDQIEKHIESKSLISDFISYFVGVLFGRFDISPINVLKDEDNIIPVLDNVWFEDDIVS